MHLLPRLVLGLLVVLPAIGRAQTADAPTASPEAVTPPPLVTPPPEPQQPPSQWEIIPRRTQEELPVTSRLTVPRILLGTLVGTAAGAGGTILGFLVGTQLTDCDVFDDVCNGAELYAIAAPSLFATGGLSSLVVYGIGSLLNGRGTFVPTLVGSLVGTGLGVAFLGLAGYGGLLLIPPLAAVGAVIGYEIADSSWSPQVPLTQRDGASVQWIPVLGITPSGGVLGGLTGRF